MTNRGNVIDHLQIIHTWAEFAHERGKALELPEVCDIEEWTRDALELLNEQEEKWVERKQAEQCRIIKCSKCGLSFIVGNNISYDEWIKDKNYCRRCGARMVKQQ